MEINANSILFLFEGETDQEFYKLFFENLPKRKIRITGNNLHGVYSLNSKVRSKIIGHLENPNCVDRRAIHVYCAIDRDGERHVPSKLDIKSLSKEFISKNSRIKSVKEVIATQDIESWFFHDLKGIYDFLRIPNKKRNYNRYRNIDKTNNYVLSELFRKQGKLYQKGKKVEGFINTLDIEEITSKVSELKKFRKDIYNLIW